MRPVELIAVSVSELESFLRFNEENLKEGSVVDQFVLHHAECLLVAVTDAFELFGRKRFKSAQTLVRTAIENLYRVSAAIENPDYAVESFVFEIDDRIQKMQRWVHASGSDPNNLRESFDVLAKFAQEIRDLHGYAGKKRWNLLETAKLSGLDWHYAADYWIYSADVHSLLRVSEANSTSGRSVLPQSMAFLPIVCNSLLARYIQTELSQGIIDTATMRLNELLDLMKSGTFRGR